MIFGLETEISDQHFVSSFQFKTSGLVTEFFTSMQTCPIDSLGSFNPALIGSFSFKCFLDYFNAEKFKYVLAKHA